MIYLEIIKASIEFFLEMEIRETSQILEDDCL